jgi:hypothetical protein
VIAGFIGGLITGLICTIVGVYLTWFSGKSDRRNAAELIEAQARIAQLEEEKNKWKALERFTPRIAVGVTPSNNQYIRVTDSATFRVTEMDYLTTNGVKVTSHFVDQAGLDIKIPIDDLKVTEVQEQGCDSGDGSFSMLFRIHIEVDGMMKPCLLPVRVAMNSAFAPRRVIDDGPS